MNALTPLALTSEPLLRVIAAGDFTSLADLAVKAGRDRRNMSRDLKVLETGCLVVMASPTRPELTPEAVEQLAAIERANPVRVLHADIERDPMNPRRKFDEAFVASLAESIFNDGKLDGLLQPLVIRPRDGGDKPYRLVAGENRWRAIGKLIAEGRWPADLPPPSSIRVMSDEEAAIMALIENMQRQDLSPVDEALTFKHLRDEMGWSNADIAKHINRTAEFVQQRQRVLELPADVQERMRLPKSDENRIGFKEARRMFQQHRPSDVPRLELEPNLALALAELAHKVQEEPAAEVSEPGFTQISGWPTVGPLAELNIRKVVTFKTVGDKTFAKILAHSSGALAWLEGQNFYVDPQAVIDHWAAQAFSDEVREKHAQLVAQYPDQPGYYTRILIMPAEIYGTYADGTRTPPAASAPEKPQITIPAIPMEILALAEISARIQPDLSRKRDPHARIEVQSGLFEMPIVKALITRSMLERWAPAEYGSDYFRVSLGGKGYRALCEHEPLFTEVSGANMRELALVGLRDTAEKAGTSLSDLTTLGPILDDFFRRPVPLPPEGQALVDRRKAEAQRRSDEQAQALAAREARGENLRQDSRQGRIFLAELQAFENEVDGSDHDRFAAEFRALLERNGQQGPFIVAMDSGTPTLFNNKGDPLVARGPMFAALRRIQVLALNHALGLISNYSGGDLPHPWGSPDPEEAGDWEPETEEEFWRIVGDTFRGRYRQTETRAAELVQLAMQRLQGIEASYGDDSSDWDRSEAEFVAIGYVEDFPDCIKGQIPTVDCDADQATE